MERKVVRNSFEKVSPTAWGIAARRADCDISFAKEIFGELEKIMTPEERSKMDLLISDASLTPFFEARYKLLNRLLKETNIKQVLELAAGVAPRGLEFTRESAVTYVETDLPEILEQKRKIIDSLVQQSKISQPNNLHLVSGNVLNDFSGVAAHFNQAEPIVIIHEGLMRYLNFTEKAKVAENIKKLLKRFGGVYINPDITLRVDFGGQTEMVSGMIGMDINGNTFASVEAAKKFFEDLGFIVEQHSYLEVKDELVSPGRLKLSEEQVQNAIGALVCFVMRLK